MSGQLRQLWAHHSLNFNLLLHRAPLKRRSILNIVLAPLSKCLRACPLYCHLGLRTLVLPHGLWALFAITIASRKVLRERKGGASATKTTHVLTQWSYCTVTTQDISFVWPLFPLNAQWIIAPDALRPVPSGCCLSPSTTRSRPSETCGKQCRGAQS